MYRVSENIQQGDFRRLDTRALYVSHVERQIQAPMPTDNQH